MDQFDIIFYKKYYDDLSSLDSRSLIEHYMKNGKNEKRLKNIYELNSFLQKIFFDADFYYLTKKLSFPNNKYRNLLIYKEYLKFNDFKNKQEFNKFLENNTHDSLENNTHDSKENEDKKPNNEYTIIKNEYVRLLKEQIPTIKII